MTRRTVCAVNSAAAESLRCPKDGESTDDAALTVATAAARAYARALAKVDGLCLTSKDSIACAWGSASIAAVAKAEAAAFASAVATADNACGCKAEAETFASALEKIFAEAAATATADACIIGAPPPAKRCSVLACQQRRLACALRLNACMRLLRIRQESWESLPVLASPQRPISAST